MKFQWAEPSGKASRKSPLGGEVGFVRGGGSRQLETGVSKENRSLGFDVTNMVNFHGYGVRVARVTDGQPKAMDILEQQRVKGKA